MDQALLDKIASANATINELRKHVYKFMNDHSVDHNVAFAGIVGILAEGIAKATGSDQAQQDQMIAYTIKALMISLAENGLREFPEGFEPNEELDEAFRQQDNPN